MKLLLVLKQKDLGLYLKQALELSDYFCDNLELDVALKQKDEYLKVYQYFIFDDKVVLQAFYQQYQNLLQSSINCVFLKPIGMKDNIFNQNNIIEIYYPNKNLLENIKQKIT